MRTILVILMGLLALAGPASAQTPDTVPAHQSFSVEFTHDGLNTTGYRVFVDGVKVGSDLPLSALTAGKVTASVAGVPRGAHTVQVSAFNLDAEAKSAALPFTAVDPTPATPTNLTIKLVVQIAGDGSVTLKLAEVAQQ
jgi:hypothetical protein